MAGYTGNTCDILTIFPMGLICSTSNAFTPFTSDGSIFLYITGGTPPYTINWTNGAHSQSLTNLQSGNYTATVIDYYGDFTATTTCTVGFDTFYLEKFTSCVDANNQIYFLGDINNQYEVNKVYSLSSQLGCWISEGLELYTAQTYSNFTAVTASGPFNLCSECIPSVPAILNTSGLCLTTTSNSNITQTQYYSGNTVNGYPSWTSTTSNEVIYFNNTNSRWQVSGWTGVGIPLLQSITSPPIGLWSLIGQPAILGQTFVTVTQGNCQTVIEAIISSNPPSCEGASNGTITITSVVGGTPPYSYSLTNDPAFYQQSNTFNNLNEGNYTVYVQDIFGNITINQVTLNSSVSPVQYNVNLNLVPPNGTTIQNSQVLQKNWLWEITITPPLPLGRQINLDIVHNTSFSAGTTNNGSPQIIYSQTTGTTGGGQYLTLTSGTTSTTSTTTACNTNNNYAQFNTSATTRLYSGTIVGTGGTDKLYGNVTQRVVTTLNGNPCATTATIRDSVSITNIQLVNQTQCEIMNTTVTPLTFITSKTGSSAPTSSNTQGG